MKPSRVEVAAPAPVILIPTYIDFARARPPDIITPAAVVLDASVVLENVGTPEAVKLPVNVPDSAPPLIVGDVNVLLVRVSVVALPTNVSVAAGRVSVPDAAAVATIVVVPEEEPATV